MTGHYDRVGAVALAICEEVDCTPRQLDYWARSGFLGNELAQRVGSGMKRPWARHHAELVWAFARLSDVLGTGRQDGVFERWPNLYDVLSARPVHPDGEVLVLHNDGVVQRFQHWCATADVIAAPVCVIPLRSFAPVTPTVSDDTPDGRLSGVPGVAGAPQPTATPNHSK